MRMREQARAGRWRVASEKLRRQPNKESRAAAFGILREYMQRVFRSVSPSGNGRSAVRQSIGMTRVQFHDHIVVQRYMMYTKM